MAVREASPPLGGAAAEDVADGGSSRLWNVNEDEDGVIAAPLKSGGEARGGVEGGGEKEEGEHLSLSLCARAPSTLSPGHRN